ncbi:UNVERIFIED_CONTAM: hypothetical protein GTU68_058947, partial [Idotea baltica]|nr:hypothetical protein [Idotea baltica]
PIGIGVSGGSDSLALLELAAKWAQERGRDVIALTFDHGLRAEAAGEAADVKSHADNLNVTHCTLTWDAPQTGQKLARRARHGALAEAVRSIGGNCLMLGHTCDDQRETFLIRARQGSHWYGLGCMRDVSVSPVWPEGRGVHVVRPLLNETRSDLQDRLRACGSTWASDPSNENAVYERVRVRQVLVENTHLQTRIGLIQKQLSFLRAVEDIRVGAWLTQNVRVDAGGQMDVDLGNLSSESLARGLSLLLQCVSGKDMPPRGPACADLAQALLSNTEFRGRTLSGVDIRRFGNTVKLKREVAAIVRDCEQSEVWDNRFERLSSGASKIDRIGTTPDADPVTHPQGGDWRCLVPIRLAAFVDMLSPSR